MCSVKFLNNLLMIVCFLIAVGCNESASAEETTNDAGWDRFFDAIWQVESSRSHNPPDGDGGKAIGPYQIWKVYWIDAVQHDKSLVANGETYQNCRDKKYAERVIRAYMNRYCTEKRLGRAPTWDDLAITHNGGPNAFRKIDTNKNLQRYLKKFRKAWNNSDVQ